MRLYSYWRSSAAYRVRIALNLKGLDYEILPVSLTPGISEHRKDAYRAINPQMLVPFLEDGDIAIGQSMAILEYLEETYPGTPLLPKNEPVRSRVRAFCNMIACDIHPLNNLRVLKYVKAELGADEKASGDWYRHWVHEGFEAAEALASDSTFVFGDKPTLADCFLVPQMYNAHRFKVPVDRFPRLIASTEACNKLPAFRKAAPEQQPDAAAN
ncbi:MAG: maleylacetoacetate isomerase [Gammaproteobacteria bacterium]|nr:maleylacetoacetate isomerase [Gammaproteobacteria bacterium]MBT8109632.1 maleylacetoacetate isomerase [Gammaproteobacteria bacterium]NND46527.1 maleylacetoacetate isomerase [Woeseiaceae bacterium]NNL44336.1 maleylacetoacetate isomerase [Woeseiaceae bacterium]